MRPLYRDADRAREYRTESKVSYRSPFRRDYARLLHCPAFRRLQGKTQLFPGAESDFFRNRLTHSLEVAQIAKSIALRINSRHAYFVDNPIDLDLIETAALAHDLGHPPFGHNGERALDECMRKKGGFEGNAQTLRILARLEKKELDLDEAEETPKSEDRRVGLNLTYRTLAAVLKYDKCIPRRRRRKAGLVKGYYRSERKLVDRVKEQVAGSGLGGFDGVFKTVECQIMDIADDIAYSTYDLEDALKTGFVSPMSMILALNSQVTVDAVKDKTKLSEDRIGQHVTKIWLRHLGEVAGLDEVVSNGKALDVAAYVHEVFESLAQDGAFRTALTSGLRAFPGVIPRDTYLDPKRDTYPPKREYLPFTLPKRQASRCLKWSTTCRRLAWFHSATGWEYSRCLRICRRTAGRSLICRPTGVIFPTRNPRAGCVHSG